MTDPKVTAQHRACADTVAREAMNWIQIGPKQDRDEFQSVLTTTFARLISMHFPSREPEEWMLRIAKELEGEFRFVPARTVIMDIIAAHAPDIKQSELYRAFFNGYRRLIEKGKDDNPPKTVAEYVQRLAEFYGSDTLVEVAEVLAKIDAEGSDV